MAQINRYTNLQPAKYTPRTLQEQMLVPAYKRQQHNALDTAASELGAIESNRLKTDEEAVSGAISEFDKELSDYRDKLNKEGFSQSNKSYINTLTKKRQDLLSNTGVVGKATKSYEAYKQNEEELKKLYTSGKISPEKYQLGIQEALSQYDQSGGVVNNGEYNSFMASPDQDIMKRAREIALDIQKNPSTLTNFGLIKKGNRYYDTKTETDYTKEEAISYAIQSILGQDQEISSDLMQREELGMFGDKTAKDYLKSIGDTHEVFYSKNNTSKTQSGFYDPDETYLRHKALDKQLKEDAVDFENYTTTVTQLNNSDDIAKLKDVRNGIIGIDAKQYMNRGDVSFLEAIKDVILGKAPLLPETFEKLEGNLKNKVENVFEGLKRNGTLSQDAEIGSKESLGAVINHMENTKDISLTPKVIKPSLKKQDEERKNIIKNARSREFYVVKDKTAYSYEQMIDEDYLTENYNENLKNSIYNGQLSSDNDYSMKLPIDYGNTWNIPHVMTIGGNEVLVSPSASELASPYNRTEDNLHKEFIKLQYSALPELYTWRYQDGDGVDITRDVEAEITTGGRYIVRAPSLKDPNFIQEDTLSADEFREVLLDFTPRNK